MGLSLALLYQGRTTFHAVRGLLTGSYTNQSGNFIKGGLRNRNSHFNQTFSAYPNGSLAPQSFILPQKSGSIASYTKANLNVSPSAQLIPAMPMIANSSINITVLTSQLDQIMQLIANGTLSISSIANLASATNMSASSNLNLSSLALLGGIFGVQASSSMNINSNTVMTALAFISASAGGATPLSPEGLAQALLDSNLIDGSVTTRQALKLILAANAGKVSGAGTSTITIRDVSDSKNRIVATVDTNGNRTSITTDVT